jgi:hypothetical protein
MGFKQRYAMPSSLLPMRSQIGEVRTIGRQVLGPQVFAERHRPHFTLLVGLAQCRWEENGGGRRGEPVEIGDRNAQIRLLRLDDFGQPAPF